MERRTTWFFAGAAFGIVFTLVGVFGWSQWMTLRSAVLLPPGEPDVTIRINDIEEPDEHQYLTPEEQRETALHESGHALIGAYLFGKSAVKQVAVLQRVNDDSEGGNTEFNGNYSRVDARDFGRMVAVCLGGRAADYVLRGRLNIGSSSDVAKANDLLEIKHLRAGLGSTLMTWTRETAPPSLLADMENELDGAMRCAERIVSANVKNMEALAAAIMDLEPNGDGDRSFLGLHMNVFLEQHPLAVADVSNDAAIAAFCTLRE